MFTRAAVALTGFLINFSLGSVSASSTIQTSSAQLFKQCTNNAAGPLVSLDHLSTCAPIMEEDEGDEASVIGPWTPWSFQPVCIQKKADDNFPNKQQRLCVYTVSSLRGGFGMSLVTTPTIAASLSNYLQDPDLSWFERQRGAPLRAKEEDKKNLPYRLKEMPGKGLGVVATRAIPKNQILLVEFPLLVKLDRAKEWPIREVYKLLQHASIRLGVPEKEALLALAKRGKGYIVDDILNTNTFAITLHGEEHSALFPAVSRINHECKPNCFSRYSPGALSIEVVSYKDISAGEELTLSYLPLNLLSEQRKEMTDELWGFNCTCKLCKDADATKVSNTNRNRIQIILESLDHQVNRTPEKVEAALTELEQLTSVEGLDGQVGDCYAIIARVYWEMGDVEKATKLGKKAVELLRHYAGFDSPRTDEAVEFMLEIEQAKRNPR